MIRAVLLILCVCGVAPQQLSAQELNRKNAELVLRAFQLQQEGELSKAIDQLEQLSPSASYDQAYVARVLGDYYWRDGQPALAIAKLSESVELNVLAPQQAWETRNMLAEILLNEQQVEAALQHFDILLSQASQPELAIVLSPSQWQRLRNNLAYVYYQLQDWPAVLEQLAELEKLQSLDINPLSMRFVAQVQLKQLKAAIETNKALLALAPETLRWWQQLSALYSQTQQHQKALSTLVSAERSGLSLGQHLLKHKAQLYAYLQVPEKAAMAYAQLDNAGSDLQLLKRQAQLWQQAREWQHSADYWQKLAQQEPKYNLQLARVLLLNKRYSQAIRALNLAKQEGQEAKAQLLLVEVLVETKDYQQAYNAAQRAHSLEQSIQSERWLEYLSALIAESKV
ncbi:hypothetical protein SNR37_002417 [Agarivorans aestuarii]|uniref:Tetratricopeptide repeat protein n=1 Tax=Agarivorans aestuarii TaxID=1563703 RepID=A0ABU7G115_9ALTE|nr:hypothetical protein [Agarivorans aestuarii]MEE1673006.1 hypothetical protein [Agarivorans aestuarii]